MRLSGHLVHAVSVGGLETCIELPELDLCFDIGRCPPSAVKHRRIFLTHAHMDHAGGLVIHAATRDLYKSPPAIWYVPRENAADLAALLEVWRRLDGSELPVELHACGPGDALPLGKGWTAKPFRSPHRVPTQGYALCRTRQRVRAELAGLPERELRDRRLAGEAVSEPVDTVEIAFTGDTLPEVIEREAAVRNARLLIMECTFVDDRVPVAKARGSGHIHLDELLERADLLQNEAILLTHFSARYSDLQILRALDRMPPGLRERVTPLLQGRTVA